ncbi:MULTISPECIES: glyoxalase superfamily protein [unclassified Micromonospora]|uniref:glyoxalase superfamily protein n=1 Tax=unclassified Micromonospora TaxID=2617518 RepID=UPI0022CA3AA4|nr:glyoxalase superfamily protein [Micromonospora sp. AKA38]GHJ14102.1 bleomycin resistance protein [Micromonospora sp. AKA38]
MTERLAPVLRVRDTDAAVAWYARLGFVRQWEHRFAPDLPRYVSIARPGMEIHLSEHAGDARPGTLVYLYVDDVDALAAACGGVEVGSQDWGRDFVVTDPDGNRIRVGTVPA